MGGASSCCRGSEQGEGKDSSETSKKPKRHDHEPNGEATGHSLKQQRSQRRPRRQHHKRSRKHKSKSSHSQPTPHTQNANAQNSESDAISSENPAAMRTPPTHHRHTSSGERFYDANDAFSSTNISTEGSSAAGDNDSRASSHSEASTSDHSPASDGERANRFSAGGTCIPFDRRANSGSWPALGLNMRNFMSGTSTKQQRQHQQHELEEQPSEAPVGKAAADVDDVSVCTPPVEYGHSEEYDQARLRRQLTLSFAGGNGASNTWNISEESGFSVRSKHYMSTKQKCQSHLPPYSPIQVELFSCSRKRDHIARFLDLPSGSGKLGNLEGRLPRFIVVNLQGPLYPPTIFSRTTDGVGLISPMVFEYNGRHIDEEALAMTEGVMKDSPAPSGGMCRDRFKMIANVRNANHLMQNKLIGRAESSLLSSYNAKPVMTKPCHRFYAGENYFEIDFDVHEFSYMPRSVWQNATSTGQIKNVVADIGFLVQGNSLQELPEQMLGCVQYSKVDLKKQWRNPPGFPEER